MNWNRRDRDTSDNGADPDSDDTAAIVHHLDELGARDAENAWRASAGPPMEQIRLTAQHRQRARRQRRRVGISSAAALVFVAGVAFGASVFGADQTTRLEVAASDSNSDPDGPAAEQPGAAIGIDAVECSLLEPVKVSLLQGTTVKGTGTVNWSNVDTSENATAQVTLADLTFTLERSHLPAGLGVEDPWQRPVGSVRLRSVDRVDLTLPNGHPYDGFGLEVDTQQSPGCGVVAVNIMSNVIPAGPPLAQFGWQLGQAPGQPGVIFSTAPLIVDTNLAAGLAPSDAASCPLRTGESHHHPNLIDLATGARHASPGDALAALLASNPAVPGAGFDEFVIAEDLRVYARTIDGAAIERGSIREVSDPFKLRQRATTAYRANDGDTLTSVAEQFGTSTAALLATNPGISTAALTPGQTVHLSPTLDELRSADLNAHGDSYEAVVVVRQTADGWQVDSYTWRDC